MSFIFTFRMVDTDKDDNSLACCYVKIDGDFYESRKKMFEARGSKWAFQYEDEDAAGVGEFNLTQKTLEEVTINKGVQDGEED